MHHPAAPEMVCIESRPNFLESIGIPKDADDIVEFLYVATGVSIEACAARRQGHFLDNPDPRHPRSADNLSQVVVLGK